MSKVLQLELQREEVKNFEAELKKMNENLYSPFQYKLWAEMLAKEAHDSLDNPVSVTMFSREKTSKATRGSDVNHSIIEKLCSALTPSLTTGSPTPATSTPTLSPIKWTGLRITYIKQLTELKQLHEGENSN